LSVGTNSYLFVIFDDGDVAKIDGAVDLINSGVYIIMFFLVHYKDRNFFGFHKPLNEKN
jgi:hypothetical protein